MQEIRERELKFDVPADWQVPDLTPIGPDGCTVQTQHVSLTSTYFDTPGGNLLASRVTLRQRLGDTDQGWQLKIPAGDARTEVRVPVGRSRTAPKELRQLVLGICAGETLGPVAILQTERTIHRLVDPTGSVLAEVADDYVSATVLGDSAVLSQWREVEVELVDGDERFLQQAARRLVKSGASNSAAKSKLGRALGDASVKVAEPGLDSLHGLIRAYVGAQRDAMLGGDLDLRRGHDVIHPTRVGSRRLRSILRGLADEFDESSAVALDVELAWYAGLLGSVRDYQVLRRHLDGVLETLSPDIVLGPVKARIDETLVTQERRARLALSRAMGGQRYFALVTELRAWHEAPPLIRADRPARDVDAYLRAAERKVNKRLGLAAGASNSDEALHRARKAGKRARYIAELAEPALGKSARTSVKRAKKLQDQLGGLQDSVLASEFLRQLGTRAGVATGENGFTFGVLWAHEQERGRGTKLAARKALS